jgi:hypothetical protein
LLDFVCRRLSERVQAEQLLNDLRPLLDEAATTFVLKLWRIVAFETEARFAGLSK